MPARWPWQTDFTEALTRIRALHATGLISQQPGPPSRHPARLPLPANTPKTSPRRRPRLLNDARPPTPPVEPADPTPNRSHPDPATPAVDSGLVVVSAELLKCK